MNKNKIIVIICIAVIAFLSISAIGYNMMKTNHDKKVDLALFDIAQNHIKSDEDFAEQYGCPTDISLCEEPIEKVSSHERIIPCMVKTDKGNTYKIYLRFNYQGEQDVFTYESVTLIK